MMSLFNEEKDAECQGLKRQLLEVEGYMLRRPQEAFELGRSVGKLEAKGDQVRLKTNFIVANKKSARLKIKLT